MESIFEDRRKWAVLMATIWIQAISGTNFDFSAYSSNLKSVLEISQIQLNYLAVASDMGKVLGWSSGIALLYFPLWSVLLTAAGMGLIGYFVQWLIISGVIHLHYITVSLLCLLSGCSICWFNTVCFVLCIRNFPTNKSLALSLSVSFNGLSAALYTLMANALSSTGQSIYLLLNAIVPFIVSLFVLVPILLPLSPSSSPNSNLNHGRETKIFHVLFSFAFLTGVYLLFLNSIFYEYITARLFLVGAVVLLSTPLFAPIMISSKKSDGGGGYNDSIDDDTNQLHHELLIDKQNTDHRELLILGEEHSPRDLIRRLDFWLYYLSYFCGATVALVYGNNIGQIMQSLGRETDLNRILGVYSAFSFFGRLLSSIPDFLHGSVFLARTGWITIALIPMPLAFFLLAEASNNMWILVAGTALIGLSSGFIFATAVSVTSQLFGPNSIGLNHNILITNIPIGSLVYGLLAALLYDSSSGNQSFKRLIAGYGDGVVICMGKKCYATTFIAWGCITLVGLMSSTALFFRTRLMYKLVEIDRD